MSNLRSQLRQLYAMRILLGFAEAGLAAGILLYMTFWFPRRQPAWAMSIFFILLPLSGIIGSPLAAAMLSWGEQLTALPQPHDTEKTG
ncbi:MULTISPECIES: hypothetical protein [Streptomyces]|uniref:hypothetical protein n=1 Tax=Streptomyces lycopersici TaxID=2974589 RepID=UPI0021D1119C|nr:hypothetical protein [Streptomyces sp. NEAU-383]